MLDAFFPAGASFNASRLFTVLLCSLAALQVALNFRDQWRFFRTTPRHVYGSPPKLLGLWQMPLLPAPAFLLAGCGLLLALVLAAVGVLPQLSLLVALVCHLLYFSQITGLSYIQRKPNSLAVALAILAVSPGIDQPLDHPAPGWPLGLVQLALAQMYFSSALQKLRAGGLAWCSGASLRAALAEHHLWAGTRAAWWLAQQPALCRLTSIGVLLWEFAFPTILFLPASIPFFAWGGVMFHVGCRVFLRIDYMRYLLPVYAVFLVNPLHEFLGVHAG